MSATIVIYRKGNTAPAATAADVKDMRDMIQGRCRVQRPGLVDLFTPARAGSKSAFYRLPEVAPSVIDNPYRRMTEHADDGFVVSATDLGRVGEATASAAQSVLLWIKQNLATVVNASDVSVVVEDR